MVDLENLDIKEQREKVGKTQIQVAREVGVSLSGYVKWEQHGGNPNEENRKKLIQALGLE